MINQVEFDETEALRTQIANYEDRIIKLIGEVNRLKEKYSRLKRNILQTLNDSYGS